MPFTMDEVRLVLSAEEPDPDELARLDTTAFPHLLTLATTPDEGLAVKATLALSHAGGKDVATALARLTESPDPAVRAAAAFGAQQLPETPDAARVLEPLLTDPDLGVRKAALRTATERPAPELRSRLEDLTTDTADAGLRDLAQEALSRLPP
jgi:HEAT repeat protein